jgi:hypothetical protein
MFGDNLQMGSLTVYLRYADLSIKTKTVLLTKSGNLGQQWLRAIVPTPEQRPFQFVIEGQVGKGNQADIAIDDVSFSEGCIKSNQLPFTGEPIISSTKKPIGNSSPKTAGSHSKFQTIECF